MSSGSETKKKRPGPVSHAVAGFLAGSVSTTLLFPLDLVKVRFQADKGVLPTIMSKLRLILREEGLRTLFAGLTPALTASAVSWAGFFFLYERRKTRNRGSHHDVVRTRAQKMWNDARSSVEAGAMMVMVTNPLWLVKTRLQLQRDTTTLSDGKSPYRGMADALARIPREEGLAALYRGVVPALLLTSHGAIQLVVYEELKRVREPTGSAQGLALVYGSVAKLAASTATYPYQVVKTRVQQRYPKDPQQRHLFSELARTSNSIKDTWRHEGLRGFFKGLWPNAIRVVPSAAITFWAYELIVSNLP